MRHPVAFVSFSLVSVLVPCAAHATVLPSPPAPTPEKAPLQSDTVRQLIDDLKQEARNAATSLHPALRALAHHSQSAFLDQPWPRVRAELERLGLEVKYLRQDHYWQDFSCTIMPAAYSPDGRVMHDLVLEFSAGPFFKFSREQTDAWSYWPEGLAATAPITVHVDAKLIARFNEPLLDAAARKLYPLGSAPDVWLHSKYAGDLEAKAHFLNKIELWYGPYQPVSPEYANIGIHVAAECFRKAGDDSAGAKGFYTIASKLDPGPVWGRLNEWLKRAPPTFMAKDELGEIEEWGGSTWTKGN